MYRKKPFLKETIWETKFVEKEKRKKRRESGEQQSF